MTTSPSGAPRSVGEPVEIAAAKAAAFDPKYANSTAIVVDVPPKATTLVSYARTQTTQTQAPIAPNSLTEAAAAESIAPPIEAYGPSGANGQPKRNLLPWITAIAVALASMRS